MGNFRDPTVMAQDALVLSKLWHALGGLYIWEYFTTLDYEWSVIRGRRPYRRTIWIYSLARVSALLTVLFDLVLLDITASINCQVAISFESAFSFLTISASSLLIVLRVIAIWNGNKIVMAMAICLWGINAAFFVQFVARLRAVWVPAAQACANLNLERSVPNLIAIPVTDIALLLMMLVGLFRLRCHHGGRFGLARVLWRQGVLWLLLALVTEVPPVVFIVLNLNDSFNVIFELPTWITMAIAATRMHRSLVDSASGSTDVFSVPGNRPNSNIPVQETKWMNAASIPTDETVIKMHIVSEQSRTPRTREDGLFISTDEHMTMHVKQNSLFYDDAVGGGL